ncbi:hypothetical protein C8F04DRAFT_1176571 [Mycena alexandri]|uniref:Uncharacterized protein n=1 Tax=Mycena alexandri TaxID=1745969 RepID=A0AAD6TA91_9AGAR|nr:hypothetical protein C8F04DRAFT_1176571 [Mycena alexandri]
MANWERECTQRSDILNDFFHPLTRNLPLTTQTSTLRAFGCSIERETSLADELYPEEGGNVEGFGESRGPGRSFDAERNGSICVRRIQPKDVDNLISVGLVDSDFTYDLVQVVMERQTRCRGLREKPSVWGISFVVWSMERGAQHMRALLEDIREGTNTRALGRVAVDMGPGVAKQRTVRTKYVQSRGPQIRREQSLTTGVLSLGMEAQFQGLDTMHKWTQGSDSVCTEKSAWDRVAEIKVDMQHRAGAAALQRERDSTPKQSEH